MRRPSIVFGFLCLWGMQNVAAQEFRIWNRNVQVHGFASQGFVYTDGNNWLTMSSRQGSAAMTDMGLNIASQVTDKFRVGAQVYDRNLGQLGQWHPSLDWATADYRFKNWLGLRAGKVKTQLGLYNDAQDQDFLRVFALLPQGVYPTDLRDTTIAHTGVDVYGNFPLPHRLGDASYTAYIGHRSDSIYSGFFYLLKNFRDNVKSVTGLQYGADFRWNPRLKGLTLGFSRMNQNTESRGVGLNLLDPTGPEIPYVTTTKVHWTNQFYAEYQWRRLRLDGEYRRCFFANVLPAASVTQGDIRAWYVAGSYRIHKRVAVGSYYSHYIFRNYFNGPIAQFFPPATDPSLPQNHTYDKVVAAHIDINRFIYVKVEGHFMNGYGLGTYPNGFYPQQNPQGFQPNTNALVLKTGFHF